METPAVIWHKMHLGFRVGGEILDEHARFRNTRLDASSMTRATLYASERLCYRQRALLLKIGDGMFDFCHNNITGR